MSSVFQLLFCASVLVAAVSQAAEPPATSAPKMRQALVDGVTLDYIEEGTGAPVVFVHGAFSDHRNWDAQRADISKRFRYIALNQRYFGTAPWSDAATKYSVATHARDLAGFIQQLGVGPVHVVAWSYGGSIALVLAAQQPHLVRSLFLNEPALGTLVNDSADQRTLAEERKGLAAALAASRANDNARATQMFADWTNGQPGSFDALPSAMREVHLENARTLPAHFASPPPPAVTCAQLGQLRVPVTVAKGQYSRPFFTVLADATHRCIPNSRLIITPNARHMAPVQNTAAFNAALMTHLIDSSR